MNAPMVLPTIHIPDEKKTGWVLKVLSQKHKNIIAMHAQSMCRADIGAACGCTPEYVSMIIAQPIAKDYMRDLERYMDQRLESMYTKSVDVIGKGLDGDATDTQLKAARLQLEVTGKLKQDKMESKSAEDVVAALLKHASSGGVIAIGNVQINSGLPNRED